MEIDEIRASFPTLADWTYLNTAFAAPPPAPVTAACRAFLEQRVTAPDALSAWMGVIDETRGLVADLIGAEPSEIGFSTAAAEGENLIAHAINWQEGDNVVFDDLAYPTTFILWHRKRKEWGIETRLVRNVDGRIDLEAMARAIDSRTRLVSVSHVSYLNGFRHDIAALADLAHDQGALLFSDATQAIGAFQVDVKADKVDFITCGVYKWLLGPVGLSFFYIPASLQEQLAPHSHGWWQFQQYAYSEDETRRVVAEDSQLFTTARRYECGSLNFEAIIGLKAALEFIQEISINAIEQRVLALKTYLETRLREEGWKLFTPSDSASGICTFFADEEEALARTLREQRVAVTARPGTRQVRVSPDFFNTRDEIDRLVTAACAWRTRQR